MIGQPVVTWSMPLIAKGLRLRARGLSYQAISVVYAEYHDFYVGADGVRKQLREHGAIPQPRGTGVVTRASGDDSEVAA